MKRNYNEVDQEEGEGLTIEEVRMKRMELQELGSFYEKSTKLYEKAMKLYEEGLHKEADKIYVDADNLYKIATKRRSQLGILAEGEDLDKGGPFDKDLGSSRFNTNSFSELFTVASDDLGGSSDSYLVCPTSPVYYSEDEVTKDDVNKWFGHDVITCLK